MRQVFGNNLYIDAVDVNARYLPSPESLQRKILIKVAVFSKLKLDMWANAQHDGRPAEYRQGGHQRRKVWLTPSTTVPCSDAAKTRNPLKFAGVP